MCFSHFLYFVNKQINSRNTTKWVEKPLNFFFFSCWKFIDIIKFNRLPYNIWLMKKKMKPRCSIHSSLFIFTWFLSFGVLFLVMLSQQKKALFHLPIVHRKINLLGFDFLVKNNFFGTWFQQSRFKQNEIGSWHTPPKHEPSHSTVKIENRKAISSGSYKTT